MFRFSSMSTSDYAYSPLPTHRGSKPHAPRRLALIYIVSGLSILVNVIGIVIVLVKVFTPPLVQSFIALDDFQQLWVIFLLLLPILMTPPEMRSQLYHTRRMPRSVSHSRP